MILLCNNTFVHLKLGANILKLFIKGIIYTEKTTYDYNAHLTIK